MSRAVNQTLSYITLATPTDLNPINGTCTVSYAGAICTMVTSQSFNITNFGDLSSSLTITFKANTSYFVNTSTFQTQLYYNSSMISSNLATSLTAYCTNPCKQCTATPTQCLSCLPNPYTLNITFYSVNNTCVSICPVTYYINSGVCSLCNQTACYGCTGSLNNCTSCAVGKYLYQNTCLSACPFQYYANNASVCTQCVQPCANCTSATVCINCITGHFLDIDSRCVTTCSNISYIGINGLCKQCTNGCKTCLGTLSYCTSCFNGTLLFNNTCVSACSSGYYNNINTTC